MHKSGTNEARLHREEAGGDPPPPPVIHIEAFDFGPARTKAMEISEFEYSVVRASHAFQHWVACAMAAADMHDMAVTDFLVLNEVNQHAHNKRLADICFILNIEDAHVVGYALRKLIGLGMVKADKHGKEVTYSTTRQGREHLQHYQEIHEQCMLDSLKILGLNKTVLKELAQFLCKMSGLYDQAARAASSL